VIGFLATGQYMQHAHDSLRGMDDARRLLFRSTHIYLLFGSLVNLALGLYLQPVRGWRLWPRTLGSLLVLSTPFFAAAGFFTEPWLADLQRPYSRPGIIICFAGMMLHGVCWMPSRKSTTKQAERP
jgi:hypothetical protein